MLNESEGFMQERAAMARLIQSMGEMRIAIAADVDAMVSACAVDGGVDALAFARMLMQRQPDICAEIIVCAMQLDAADDGVPLSIYEMG